MKKNPFHSLAVPAVNRKFERHIQGTRDKSPALRMSRRNRYAEIPFKQANPVFPFCK